MPGSALRAIDLFEADPRELSPTYIPVDRYYLDRSDLSYNEIGVSRQIQEFHLVQSRVLLARNHIGYLHEI